MATSNLEKMLWQLRDGKIDFGAFVLGTRTEYRAMAAYLLRRWVGPEWFTQDDLEQELYLETWHHVWGYVGEKNGHVDYEPGRGVTLSRWVVYGAMGKAKRELHKARGVTISGSPDRKPSNFETPASFIVGDGAEADFIERMLHAEEPLADAVLEAVETTRTKATKALQACATKKERYAVLAIRDAGSLDGAARVLYDNVDRRSELRLGCEDAAERFVERHAWKVAQRMNDVTPG